HQLLILCGSNEKDKDYIDLKIKIEGLKSYVHDLELDKRFEAINSQLDEELTYIIRGKRGADQIANEFLQFKKKYNKKLFKEKYSLFADDLEIATIEAEENFEKKKTYCKIIDLTSKAINSYNSLKYKKITLRVT
ncbi:MAG: hypothetical protein ACRCXZ_09075, partial [Patescibacteria group bacterium]